MPRVATKHAPEVEKTSETNGSEKSGTVIHEVPFAEPRATGFRIHVEMELIGEVAMALRRIAEAYDRQQATLRDGTRVVRPTTALRKILEGLEENMR